MALIALHGMRGAGVVQCPHCAPEAGQESIEIRTYLMRTDYPKDAA